MLQENAKKELTEVNALKKFFMECKQREQGQEPDWSEQKRLISDWFKVQGSRFRVQRL
jgi:hypothetical protein